MDDPERETAEPPPPSERVADAEATDTALSAGAAPVAAPLAANVEESSAPKPADKQPPPVPPPPPPLPLEPKPREFLLAEARDRYKAEHDRYNQAYTRAGIYFGVLAVYVNVLVRFLDKPPPTTPGWLHSVFWVAHVALLLIVLVAISCIVGAILGRHFGFVPAPDGWVQFVNDSLRPYYATNNPTAILDDELDGDLREQVLARYAEAIDINVKVNQKRFGWLHRASYWILSGLFALAIATAAYGCLLYANPRNDGASAVRVIDPVEVRPYGWSMSKPAAQPPAPAPAPAPVAPSPPPAAAQPTAQPAQPAQAAPAPKPQGPGVQQFLGSPPREAPLPPKPQGPAVRLLKEGQVPKKP